MTPRSEIIQSVYRWSLFVMLSGLFLIWGVLGPWSVARQNNLILSGVRAEIVAHAHGSASRSCAIAQEFKYFVSIAPDIKPAVTRHVERFTRRACSYTAIP